MHDDAGLDMVTLLHPGIGSIAASAIDDHPTEFKNYESGNAI